MFFEEVYSLVEGSHLLKICFCLMIVGRSVWTIGVCRWCGIVEMLWLLWSFCWWFVQWSRFVGCVA